MPVGDAPELHTRFLPIFEQLKLQFARLTSGERGRQLSGCRTEIFDKSFHFRRMFVSLIGHHTQLEVVFESTENAPQLFYNV